MQIKEIMQACGAERLCGNEELEVTSYSNDTRTIQAGALYIPIVGEVFDGHQFISQAFKNGAVATLTSRKNLPLEGTMLYVDDTLKAIQQLAHYVRMKAKVQVVGITGSVGKTSTRDLVGAVVASHYSTLKTEGNFNNHLGLPLTILRYKNEKAFVLEMGMNHEGEISLLSQIARPNIGVITNVGTAHIGNLGSREGILKAKMEIVDGFEKGAILIVNNDNDLLHKLVQNNTLNDYTIKTFGIENISDVNGQNICLYQDYSTFEYQGVHFRINVPGSHFVLNALCAISVGECMNIPLEKMAKAIENFKLTKNRMDIERIGRGMTLIDGTYNANLDSMISSLNVLGQYQNRKVAVLADMLELGDFSYDLHYQAGQSCLENKVDLLVCIGKEAKAIVEGAKGVQTIVHFENNQDAIAYLHEHLQDEDIILVKGSNGMKLKEIVSDLKENR